MQPPPPPPPQQQQRVTGSPESLFSDGELDSVLLPPEVMASAPALHDDFLCNYFDDDDDDSNNNMNDDESYGNRSR